MVVPSEQNVFVAPHLGFCLARTIGGTFELYWEWKPSCSK